MQSSIVGQSPYLHKASRIFVRKLIVQVPVEKITKATTTKSNILMLVYKLPSIDTHIIMKECKKVNGTPHSQTTSKMS